MQDDAGKKVPSRESLSFDALTEEFGDTSILLASDAALDGDREAAMEPPYRGTVIIDDEPLAAAPNKEGLPFRVLTGSSPQPVALWLQGAMASGLALLFLLPVLLESGMKSYQPGISYVVIMLGGGGGLWSLYGLKREKTSSGKKRCWAVALCSLVIVLIAYWVRML